MRRDMLCHWMSTAKPVAAIAIGQLLDRQLLSLASPVATHIPEFGCHGKEAVLVEHLLTHTSGFPFADSECWRDSMGDWSRVLDAICRARGLKVGVTPASLARLLRHARPLAARLAALARTKSTIIWSLVQKLILFLILVLNFHPQSTR